jgi:hypothetical protein
MKARAKIAASVAGVVLLCALACQTTHGQGLLNESGVAILADTFGSASGPDALLVSWSVAENQSDVYTYSYVVINPPGDVVLNNNGVPTLSPESVDAFSVVFNTLASGAFISGSEAGGTSGQNDGEDGLFWSFSPIQPNASSPTLSFESDLPPMLGNANAQDDNAPSPWSSFPNGQQVAIPISVPEPSGAGLFVFGAMLVFPFQIWAVNLTRLRRVTQLQRRSNNKAITI